MLQLSILMTFEVPIVMSLWMPTLLLDFLEIIRGSVLLWNVALLMSLG